MRRALLPALSRPRAAARPPAAFALLPTAHLAQATSSRQPLSNNPVRASSFHTSSLRRSLPQLLPEEHDAPVDLDEPPEHAPEPSKHKRIQLRPYQLDCIDAVLNTLKDGQYSRIGVSAPTGSGKTAIFTSLIHRLPPLINPHSGALGNRVLILAGSIVLAQQAADTVRRTYPELTVEIEQGTKNVATGLADVTVATYQTLARGGLSRLDKFDPNTFKAVIIDEAHHAVAPSYLAILARFDSRINSSLSTSASSLMDDGIVSSHIISATASTSTHTLDEPDPPPEDPVEAQVDENGQVCVPLLAFTATWGRADGLALGKVFEKVVWHGEWLDMIRGSWLSQLQFTTIKLGDALDMSSVNVSAGSGEFVMASLAKAVDKTEVNKLAVEAWLEKAQGCRSTLVFAVNIHHIVSLTNAFRDIGIDARFVHEGIHVRDREEIYQAFRRGEFPVLINCGILTEGADFPAIDCVLLGRPTRSKNLFLQMIGRGLRLSPETGKTSCLIIDLVGNSTAGIVCTPTLFGIDPDRIIEAQSTDQLEQRAEEEEEANAKLKLAQAPEFKFDSRVEKREVQYEDFATVFDLVDRHSETPVSITSMSPLAWIGTGDGAWILELMSKGHVKVSLNKQDGRYEAHLYRRIPTTENFSNNKKYFNPFARPTQIASHRDLPILLRTVDAHLQTDPSLDAGISLRRSASWRRNPMSPSQRSRILAKLAKPVAEEGFEQRTWIEGVWIGKPWKERVEIDEVNRGVACDIISRLSHGGLGSWKTRKKVLEREEKRRERDRQGKARAMMKRF